MSSTTAEQQERALEERRYMQHQLEKLREENAQMFLRCRAAEKQLLKEKKLKDVYIERGKQQRKELEKLHFYDEAGALRNHDISLQVRTRERNSNRRNLQKDYEELQVAYMISQREVEEELQQEKNKCSAVQKELDDFKVSYQNISSRYDTEVSALRQQADFFHDELEKEKESNEDRLLEEQRVISDLRAEKDALYQKMAQDYNILQQKAFNKERDLLKELEELKFQLSLQKNLQQENEDMKEAYNTSQERFAAELQREKNKNKLLQEEQDSLRDTVRQQAEIIQSNEGRVQEYQQTISTMKAEQDAMNKKMAEELRIQISINSELMKEKETRETPQADTTSCQEETEAEPCQQEEAIPETSSIKVQEKTEESEEQIVEESSVSEGPSAEHQEDLEEQIMEHESSVLEEQAVGGLQSEGEVEVSGENKNPSRFKRFRHALGLKKPQRWKKKKETVPSTPQPLPSDSSSRSPSPSN